MKIRRLRKPTPAQLERICELEKQGLSGCLKPKHVKADDPGQAWFIVEDEGKILGFAAAKLLSDGGVMLTRCVVARPARGQGLQRALIRARVRWAKKIQANRVWTYTQIHNVRSAGHLGKEGFHYRGCDSDKEWLYWRLSFDGLPPQTR